MEKKWNLLQTDASITSALQAQLNIHPALCRILQIRQIDTYDKAKKFFRPQLPDLHDPWLMKDMREAVRRIDHARKNKEKILVYGDYDVDGTTAVASMYDFLSRHIACHLLDFYIPHRYREGYGVSKAGIQYAKDNGVSLIIALDCGIKSAELVAEARSSGIDFIICDHHLPDKDLPKATAILNPKQPECPYPYKELCGCGIGFKLITALCENWELPPENAHDYLDLVATAIAADIVPMTGENRVLAFYGLIKVNTRPNTGIDALKKISGLTKELKIENLVFMIAPRVNAAGRMDDARKAVQLFLSKDVAEAETLGNMLHSDNAERKEADKQITEQALAEITDHPEWKNRTSTVVFDPGWHKGVVGIVASRLIEHYYRPTIVLTRSGDYATGSARSIPGFNLYEALHACKEYLIGYGGHYAAAGLTLEVEKVNDFREKFEEVVKERISPSQLIPELTIDTEVDLPDLTEKFYSILRQMEPIGPENQRPLLLVRNIRDTGFSKVLKDQHIKFSVRQGNHVFQGIGFYLAHKFPLLEDGRPVDIAFTLEENEWNGNKNLQLKVVDLRPHLVNEITNLPAPERPLASTTV